jgi:alpha/beta hydrolase fold
MYGFSQRSRAGQPTRPSQPSPVSPTSCQPGGATRRGSERSLQFGQLDGHSGATRCARGDHGTRAPHRNSGPRSQEAGVFHADPEGTAPGTLGRRKAPPRPPWLPGARRQGPSTAAGPHWEPNGTSWTALLGQARGTADVSPYEAPARATDLSWLPPAFIDVGPAETFRDKAITYASRIWQAGESAEPRVWPGGFHGLGKPGA